MKEKVYFAIDLKSFYASAECAFRHLDPLKTNLVVADTSRSEKTICLAVSPSLKKYNIPGRARLFEVIEAVKKINLERLKKAHIKKFIGSSFNEDELAKNSKLKLDYIAATPQMAKYIKMSGAIYQIYLKYFSEESIHVYSIDEVFIDATNYLAMYHMSPRELVSKVVAEIYEKTHITATAGIGSNLFLAKVAMDIIAKHVKPDKNGVRIGELDTLLFRKKLWHHTPLTDFWRIGAGTVNRLNKNGMYDLYDVCKKSLEDEDLLFNIFGVNAELLIDHAWGIESAEISDIKHYTPTNKSLSSGQVLSRPYSYDEMRTITKEMADSLSLDLTDKKLKCAEVVLYVGYEKIKDLSSFTGEVSKNYYGILTPSSTGGGFRLDSYTSSFSEIKNAALAILDETFKRNLKARRIYLVAVDIKPANIANLDTSKQLDLFNDYVLSDEHDKQIKKEEKLQKTINDIKKKYGKNAILKGNNLLKEATMKERNKQIGGHKA